MTDIGADARGLRWPAVCVGCLAIVGFHGSFVAGAFGVRPGANSS